MTSVGWATLDVIPSFKGLSRELDKGTSGPMRSAGLRGGTAFGNEAGRAAGSRFGSLFSKAAKASLIGVAGGAALAFKVGADSIEQASDLGESLNAVNVTYGKQARAVKRLGRESAKALGLSNAEFNGLAVQYSAFAKTIGGDKKTVKTLDDLTTRAADFASVMNLEVSEAAGLFQSGLAGETEPLRRFGIDLSAASVQAFAYKNGIAEAGEELTEQEKVQARYASLMEQTSKTQGDFANTSDSLANRQRVLNARWDDARAKLGRGLLPVVEDLVGVILEDGIPAFERFSDWMVDTGIPALKDTAKFARHAGERVGDMVQFFKGLPSPAKYAGIATLLGGGAALKLRAGGGGLLGTAGKIAGLTKPVPVFVTNMGVGGVGLGGLGGEGGKAGKLGLARGVLKATVIGGVALYATDLYVKRIRTAEGYTNNNNKDATDPDSVFADPRRRLDSERLAAYLGAIDDKAKGFGKTLDLVGGKKVEPKFAVPGLAKSQDGLREFLRLQINAGKPITPYINTTSIERAIAQARTLNAELAGHSVPTAGTDNGVGFQHGSTGGTNSRGVTIQKLEVHGSNLDEILKDGQRKLQRRGHGGFGG